jgi:hypothetical protein
MGWQAALDDALGQCRAVDVTALPDVALLAELDGLLAARDVLDGLIARRLEVADVRQATVAECGLTTTMWLRSHARLSAHEARQRMFVARSLAHSAVLAETVDAGQVTQASARIIASTLRQLDPDDREAGAGILVELAAQAPPEQVGVAARHLLHATAAAETREAAEQRRLAGRYLTIDATYDGMYAVTGMLPPDTGEALAAAVGALAQPAGGNDERSAGQRRADALGQVARHLLACDGLPDNGGERPQLVLTLNYADLSDALTGSGHAATPGDTDLTDRRNASGLPASVLRRLACDAAVIPAVLGAAGEVLDIGRATRTWPTAIRRAARLRDRGCTFPGCAAGLDQCDLHHLVFWADGGTTSLTNAAHLCAFHHWLIHDKHWTARRTRDGTLLFTRPDGTTVHDPALARAG